jgi:AAA family ATP:ADP antiporter
MSAIDSKNSKNPLERFLGLFTDVRGGEGTTVLLLALNVFLLLVAYSIIKPVREALILSGGGFSLFGREFSGASKKAVVAVGQSILLLGIVPLYSAIAGRFPRRRLINVVTFFFAGCLAVFFILAQIRIPLGIAFYIWIGIFSVMVISQFWSFANDLYTPQTGKRLFAIVAFGASSGAVVGAWVAKTMIRVDAENPGGVYPLLLVGGVILALSLLITNIVHLRERSKTEDIAQPQAEVAEKPIGKGNAYRLVFGNKYLLLIALLMLFLNWVNTSGEYILSWTVEDVAKKEADNVQQEIWDKKYKEALDAGTAVGSKEAFIEERKEDHRRVIVGDFYAGFHFWVNIIGLLIQLFIVSRVLKYLGVRVALLVLPIIAFCGYAFIIIYPALRIIRVAKTAENSTDYSLQNTVRHVLFLPTTREQKYQAKQAIDTLFVRIGDFLASGLFIVGTTFLALGIKQLALINLVLVLIWVALAIMIGRENRRLTSNGEPTDVQSVT